jgi:hypothetical protein
MMLRGAIVLIALLVSDSALAQSTTARPAANGRPAPLRTPDGRPDLQGVWHIATATPLERPAEFADRPFLTEEEAAAWLTKTRNLDRREQDPARDLDREENEFWVERPTRMAQVNGRIMASLVVDPADGKVPRAVNAAPVAPVATNEIRNVADNPEDRHPGERCLGDWAGPPMVGGAVGSNAYLQIVQTPGYVVLYSELSTNTARIVPLGRREHTRGDMRFWRGDSVGWWEGETLVIDSINFTIGAALINDN